MRIATTTLDVIWSEVQRVYENRIWTSLPSSFENPLERRLEAIRSPAVKVVVFQWP